MSSYAIRHALEALGDAGYDEEIRRAALAELDDLEEDYRIADSQRTAGLDRAIEAEKWANTMQHERDWERDVVRSEMRSRIAAFESAAEAVLDAVKRGHEHQVDEALSLLAECLADRPFSGALDDDRLVVPEGDQRCSFVMDACTCMKRKGHDGLHACVHGGWRGEVPGA